MYLTPTESDQLQIFVAAEMGRRARARGLKLNAPEATAIICDEMHLAARSGASYDEVLEAVGTRFEPTAHRRRGGSDRRDQGGDGSRSRTRRFGSSEFPPTTPSGGRTLDSRSIAKPRADTGSTCPRARRCASHRGRRSRLGSSATAAGEAPMADLSHDEHIRRYGPTVGDRIRLGRSAGGASSDEAGLLSFPEAHGQASRETKACPRRGWRHGEQPGRRVDMSLYLRLCDPCD